MPFNKSKQKQVKEITLPEALGMTNKRAHQIADQLHEMIHSMSERVDSDTARLDNSKILLAVYNRYDDKELLFAVYALTRILSRHEASESPFDEILNDLKKFLEN